MHVSILTPERTLHEEEASEITVPTALGEITILPGHVSLVTKVAEGEILLKSKGKGHHFAVTGGFLQVENDTITLLADYAVRSEDINTQRVLEAKKRAEEQLKRQREGVSERDYALAAAEMRRSILELKVANKRSKTRQI